MQAGAVTAATMTPPRSLRCRPVESVIASSASQSERGNRALSVQPSLCTRPHPPLLSPPLLSPPLLSLSVSPPPRLCGQWRQSGDCRRPFCQAAHVSEEAVDGAFFSRQTQRQLAENRAKRTREKTGEGQSAAAPPSPPPPSSTSSRSSPLSPTSTLRRLLSSAPSRGLGFFLWCLPNGEEVHHSPSSFTRPPPNSWTASLSVLSPLTVLFTCGVQRYFSQLRWTLHQNGFHRCQEVDDPTCVLHWGNRPPPANIRRRLTHPQVRILHFPHLTELTHKQRCSRNVERQRTRGGVRRRLFPAIPTSFVLPDRSTEWLAEHRRMGGDVHPAVQSALEESQQLRGRASRREVEGEGEAEVDLTADAESAAYYAAVSSPLTPSPVLSSPPVWIVKPSARGSGHGIVVSDLRCPSPLLLRALRLPYVAQRYVERPLLLDGHKMDCRLYVALLSSLAPSQVPPFPDTAHLFPGFPFQVFLYDDGLIRVASEPYSGTSRLDDPFVHLTNNSLARQRSPDCGQAQNRSFRRWLSSTPNPFALLHSIDLLVLSTVASSSALLRAASSPELASNFALLGFDVLLDDCYTPWLCEVNHLPDLQLSASPYSAVFPVDCSVKTRLIADLLSLLRLPKGDTGVEGQQPDRGPDREREEDADESSTVAEREPQLEARYCMGGFRRLV